MIQRGALRHVRYRRGGRCSCYGVVEGRPSRGRKGRGGLRRDTLKSGVGFGRLKIYLRSRGLMWMLVIDFLDGL